MKRILSLSFAVFSIISAWGDAMSDWQSRLQKKDPTTDVAIGDEWLRWGNGVEKAYNELGEDVNFASGYYRFKCGAELHRTAAGYRLDINGLATRGISSLGDIAICLSGDSAIGEDGICSNNGSLLLFGTGGLSVVGKGACGIYAHDNLSICGPSITVSGFDDAVEAEFGDLLISGSAITLQGFERRAVYAEYQANVLGAVVTMASTLEGACGIDADTVVVDGSMVSAVTHGTCLSACQGLAFSHSYITAARTANCSEDDTYYSLAAIEAYGILLDSPAYISFDSCCTRIWSHRQCLSAPIVEFGKGSYRIGSRQGGGEHAVMDIAYDTDARCAVEAPDQCVIDGGDVKICSPGGIGIRGYGEADNVIVRSGRLESVASLNVKTDLAFDAAVVALYVVGLGVDVRVANSLTSTFCSTALVGAYNSGRLMDLKGAAYCAISGGWYDMSYRQTGGTVIVDGATYGLVADKAVITGGSFHGSIRSIDDSRATVPVVNGSDVALSCIPYVATEIGNDRKVSQNWAGILPSYYGTMDLYADGSNKLYFWLPEGTEIGSETGTETGGSTDTGGGSDIGGGSDTGGGGSGTGGGSDTGGGGSTSSGDRLNLKLVSFMPAIKRDDGNILNRKEFTVGDDVYFILNIFAYRDGVLIRASEDVQYTVKVSNGFEKTYLFDKSATGLGGYPIAVSMGRFPPGKYTMTCSINPNGLLEDLDPTDNVRTDSFEVIAEPGWNFVFDGSISVEGAAGRPVKATMAFHDEVRHPVVYPVECLFSVRANGREVGSFVKSYGVGPAGWIKDTVDLAKHMSLPMGDYELTCRLDSNSAYAETNENNNEQTVSFRVAYPNVSVWGFFDTRVAHSYRGVLFRDRMTVLGTVAFQASAKNTVDNMVRITGTVTEVTGKKHALTGSTIIGKSVSNAIECQVDVEGFGTFDLMLGDYFVIDNCYIGSKEKTVFAGDNGAGLSMCSLIDGIELELPQTQTPPSGGSVLPFASAAAVYDGSLQLGGRLVGTIQVKVAKGKTDKKTGAFSAKVTATVQLADGSKKITFKNGVADEYGNVTGLTAAGHALSVSLGASGMAGTMDGNSVDGARNVFSAKDAASKATAAAIEKQWVGAINVVGDGVVLSVTVAKKGKVKVAGTVDGVKVSATSQLLVGAETCCIPVVIAKRANLAFNLWLRADGSVEIAGLDGAIAGKAKALKSGAAFRMDGAALARALPGLYGDYLPGGLSVAQSGAKWVVAGGAKAGKLKLIKDSSEIDREKSKFTDNMSGLKLTYKTKDGSFKGSFKAYALENGKIRSYTVNVTGVMVGDTGYGTATCKKPAASFPITVE